MANWWDKNLTDKQKFRLQDPQDASLLNVVSAVPTPISDVASGLLAAQDVSRGNYGMAALNALGLLPFVPSMGAVVKNAGKSAKTEFELAHDLAQKNAALPVAEGGLGLPATNTAMDRAKALGYTQESYKGMYPYDVTSAPSFGYKDGTWQQLDKFGEELQPITAINPDLMSRLELSGKHSGFYGDKDVANRFAGYNRSGAVFPVLLNMGDNPVIKNASGNYAGSYQFEKMANKANTMDDWRDFQKAFYADSDKTGAILKNTTDEGTIFIPKNPNQIRSINAAFDPFRRNEADILAGVAPLAAGSLLGLNTYNNMQDKPKKEKKKN